MSRQLLKEIHSRSLEEFRMVANTLRTYLSEKSVVAFQGPMGAGKTEFVRALCALEKAPGVSSPTFAIHQRYQGATKSIDHLDLFRLKVPEELDATGFWDFFSDAKGLILIEWPEKMDLAQIPLDWDLIWVEIQIKSQSERQVQIFKRV